MSIDDSKDEKTPIHTDAYYEEVASQEEIYLEEREEEVRAILIFDETPSSENRTTQSLEEQFGQAAKDLIVGDSDDPPLSEEVIVEMVDVNVNEQRHKLG